MPKLMLFGVLLDSQIEADRYLELRERWQAGEIADLTPHPEFVLVERAPGVRRRVYTADFRYQERRPHGAGGHHEVTVVEEIKPRNRRARSWSRDFPLRLALARERYPEVEFRVIER